jgi:hypothetical protein
MQQMMQSLASATAAAVRRGSSIDRLSLHAIDYAHFQASSLFHATASDYDGSPKLSWSYDCDGSRQERSLLLSHQQLESLWNGLSDLNVFQQSLVNSGDIEINPFAFHVVGFASQDGAIPAIGLFLVPADKYDAEFESWMLSLNPPANYEFQL